MEQESLHGIVQKIYNDLADNGELDNLSREEAKKLVDTKIYTDYGIEM